MIVTRVPDPPVNRRIEGAAPTLRWICMARRGMLHSECEAVDHLTLPAGARLDRRGRDGIGEVWFLLSGAAETLDGLPLRAGQLLVIPPEDTRTGLVARGDARLLVVSVLGDATVAALASRRPDLVTVVG